MGIGGGPSHSVGWVRRYAMVVVVEMAVEEEGAAVR